MTRAGRRGGAVPGAPAMAGGDAEVEAALVASLDVAAGREIGRRSAGKLDHLSAYVLGGGFAIVAILFAALERHWSPRVLGVMVVLAAVYTAAYRIEFESAFGSCVPTEPVLVVALFLLPAGVVPVMVLIALLAGALAWAVRESPGPRTVAVRVHGGWHCLGPLTVFLLFDVTTPDLHRWPVLLLALAAQFAIDGLVAILRFLGTGGRPGDLVRPLGFTFSIDALLAPLGLAAAAMGHARLGSIVPVLALLVLIAVLAHDRRRHVDSSVALGEAVVVAREEARVDAMTGLANRRGWEEAAIAAQHLLDGDRSGTSVVAVVLADLDGLKTVNDTVGHEAGDALIRSLADLLRRVAPRGSCVARVGGDEFAVLVTGTKLDEAGPVLVHRLRAAIAALDTLPSGQRLSASFGTASAPPETSVLQAYRTADKAVFTDKSTRRVERRSSLRRVVDRTGTAPSARPAGWH